MHSVRNEPAPIFLVRNGQRQNAFERKYSNQGRLVWDFGNTESESLSAPPVGVGTRLKDYVDLIRELAKQFNGPHPDARDKGKLLGICGYCERVCEDRIGPNMNTVDHFRPRASHNDLTFEWFNLMYVCRRCNGAKNDGMFSTKVDQAGFVNPREKGAEYFFGFDLNTGAAVVHPGLNDVRQRAKAQRTIEALGLDKEDINRLRRDHLLTVRRLHTDKGHKLSPFKRRKVQFSSIIRYAEKTKYFEG